MLLLLVLWSLLAIEALAYAPIWLMQTSTRALVVVPESYVGSVRSSKLPQRLVTRDLGDNMSSRMTPCFTAKHDNTIVLDGMGWCMDSDGSNGDSSGNAVFINRCTGALSQKWNWMPDGHGFNLIQSIDTLQCLEAVTNAFTGISLVLRKCENKSPQTWKFEEPVLVPTRSHAFGLRQLTTFFIAFAGIGIVSLRAWLWWRKRASRLATSQVSSQWGSAASSACPLAMHEGSIMTAHDYCIGPIECLAMWALSHHHTHGSEDLIVRHFFSEASSRQGPQSLEFGLKGSSRQPPGNELNAMKSKPPIGSEGHPNQGEPSESSHPGEGSGQGPLVWAYDRLRKAIEGIVHLDVRDVSDGHTVDGYYGGTGRALTPNGLELEVTVVSPIFDGMRPLKRQRLVNDAFDPEFRSGRLHSLPRLKTWTPAQWQEHSASVEPSEVRRQVDSA